ncbi:hypothetical protein EXU57_17530 [Segetibacter sp. 3557_3]|uniref:hypothetical protein n=1 Tax=Segetibacter sp. 3557_3 TaxID=2547429 RepID=UPI00105898C1|nr:hypothetical protein [Segetibacter sp. 3557_3]TDH23276.1 hypothetical protein EXU57_17530 [Segetibacter sp. 3557_3]
MMRRIFHENIDKAQRAIDKVDRKEDKFVFPGKDEAENQRVSTALYAKVDEIKNYIEHDKSLEDNAKIKYLRGLAETLTSFELALKKKQVTPAQLPELVMGFKTAQELEKKGLSIVPVIEVNPPEIGDILIRSYSFQQNVGLGLAKNIIMLKTCEKNPNQILPLLLKNPNVHFADSLIKTVAYIKQEELYTYAQSTNTQLGRRIQRIDEPLVKMISKLATMNTGRLYFPFLDDLYKGKTTIEELDKDMSDDTRYYRLLVKTEIKNAERLKNNDTPMAMHALTSMLRKKAVDVYINAINGLHEQPDQVRFRSLEPLSPQELYFLCIMGEEDIYTSSYLGVYKRIFQKLKSGNSDSLLASVNYDHFKKFIKMAANYNMLDDFLKKMESGRAETLMRSFAAGLEKTDNLEDAVDVADSYASISDPGLRKLIMEEIDKNYNRVKTASDKRGVVIYDILQTVFQSIDSTKKVDLSEKFGIPPIYSVRNNNLRDTSGRIIIQQFFYGDKDGVTVFNNFKAAYSNANWKIINKPEWIEVVSTRGTPVTIYSNRPLDEEKDLDAKAQKSLGSYLYEKDLQPTVVIHRGHSYYVKYTIEQLAPSAKVVLLGSCGGYHALNEVLGICPFAHIIASKQVGTGTVNQPMIIALTETLRQGRDLNWPSMWKDFEKRFKGNERFDDYVPPYNNLGAIFIMVYNKSMDATPGLTEGSASL